MSLKKVLGHNIRYYHYENGYSQQTLAELLNILVTYMSDIECGKSNVSLDLIENICKLFELPYEALFVKNDV